MSFVFESYGVVSVVFFIVFFIVVYYKGDVEDRYENFQGYSNEYVFRGDIFRVEWVESVYFCCVFFFYMLKWV